MIVNVGGTGEKTTIGELHGGDCFHCGGRYYMKLECEVMPNCDGKYPIGYSSVCLDNGALACFGEKDKITPVEAVVTIEFKQS